MNPGIGIIQIAMANSVCYYLNQQKKQEQERKKKEEKSSENFQEMLDKEMRK